MAWEGDHKCIPDCFVFCDIYLLSNVFCGFDIGRKVFNSGRCAMHRQSNQQGVITGL